jgi:hypothetical protein
MCFVDFCLYGLSNGVFQYFLVRFCYVFPIDTIRFIGKIDREIRIRDHLPALTYVLARN